MEQKTSTLNYSLKWGIIIGVILIIYSLLLYMFDLMMNKALGWVSYLILLVAVFIAVKNFRDKVKGGFISFGNAFSVSFLIFIFSGILSAIFSYVLYKYIAPELIDKISAITEEQLINKGLSEDMVEAQMNMARKFMSPGIMVGMALFWTALIGAVISLIIAAITKKEGNPFSTQQTV